MARNILSQKERFTLTNYVQKFYAEFGTSDRIFAETATGVLGFEINASHVLAARDVLDIQATKFVAATPEKIIDRIALLEKRLAVAEEAINQLYQLTKK